MPILKNAKHERFAQELAKGADCAQAYVTAGFRPNPGNARRLRADEAVLKRIEALLSEREAVHAQATAITIEKAGLTKQWIIERLQENVERSMQAIAVKDAKGEPTGKYKYDGAVANRALELLGKELGMFIDRKEVGGAGDFERMSDQELNDFIAREMAHFGFVRAPGAQH